MNRWDFQKELLELLGLQDIGGIQELTLHVGLDGSPVVHLTKYVDYAKAFSRDTEKKTYIIKLEEIKEDANV